MRIKRIIFLVQIVHCTVQLHSTQHSAHPHTLIKKNVKKCPELLKNKCGQLAEIFISLQLRQHFFWGCAHNFFFFIWALFCTNHIPPILFFFAHNFKMANRERAYNKLYARLIEFNMNPFSIYKSYFDKIDSISTD